MKKPEFTVSLPKQLLEEGGMTSNDWFRNTISGSPKHPLLITSITCYFPYPSRLLGFGAEDLVDMNDSAFQQVVRCVFSADEWALLMDDPLTPEKLSQLNSIEEVEAFVFEAYERIRSVRNAAQGALSR